MGVGIALTGFTGLKIRPDGADWTILVRRNDFAPDPLFASLHGRRILAEDLAPLLPRLALLAWTEVPANILSQAESSARDREYQVSVRAEPGSAKTHAEVVAAFLDFMAQR
ncbi:MAG: hypothetical protein AB1452_04595 [Pseudomonadota bacterium]